jgi:hypothetical protein
MVLLMASTPRWRVFLTLGLVGLTAGCGASAPTSKSCVEVPENIPNLASWGIDPTVDRGEIVYVGIDESAGYESGVYLTQSKRASARADARLYNLFPWETPRSSTLTVLAPVRTCPLTGMSSLAETVTAFRAVGAGSARVVAPLVPAWRSARYRPPVFRTTVTVRP